MRRYPGPLLVVSLVFSAIIAACSSADSASPSPVPTSGSPRTIATVTATAARGVSSTPQGQSAYWCPAGTYSQTVGGGITGGGAIEGLVQFRGKTYCKTVATAGGSGVSVTYTYYWNQDSSEAWSVSDVNGQVTEIHYVNGQVVSNELNATR